MTTLTFVMLSGSITEGYLQATTHFSNSLLSLHLVQLLLLGMNNTAIKEARVVGFRSS